MSKEAKVRHGSAACGTFSCPDEQGSRNSPAAGASTVLSAPCSLQHYWARSARLYRYVPVREFAQAYRHSSAGEGQDRALRTPFRQTSAADSALAWAKHAITGAVLQLFTSQVRQGALCIGHRFAGSASRKAREACPHMSTRRLVNDV